MIQVTGRMLHDQAGAPPRRVVFDHGQLVGDSLVIAGLRGIKPDVMAALPGCGPDVEANLDSDEGFIASCLIIFDGEPTIVGWTAKGEADPLQ